LRIDESFAAGVRLNIADELGQVRRGERAAEAEAAVLQALQRDQLALMEDRHIAIGVLDPVAGHCLNGQFGNGVDRGLVHYPRSLPKKSVCSCGNSDNTPPRPTCNGVSV